MAETTNLILLALATGVGIGLSLGLLGGGGSILTVPALVYILGQDVSTAAATSLIVVGTNALLGTGAHFRARRVRWRTALVFGGAGLLGALPGAKLNHILPGALILLLFAGVMLAAAILMVRRRHAAEVYHSTDCPTSRYCITAAVAGVGVGFMTGFFGVGGGFLIVPALAGVLRFAMPQAVGTSLAIIALNSASGLIGYFLFGHVQLGLAIPLVAGGAAGIALGAALAGRVPDKGLRQMFALMLLALALFLIVENAPAVWHLWA